MAHSRMRLPGTLFPLRAAAAGFGITGIPTFIVDGRWIIEGAVPVEMMREAAIRIFAGKA